MSYVTKTLLLGLAAITASEATAAPKKADPQAQTKYCMQIEASTGSRIARTECRTKAEWAIIGVDVDEVLPKQ